MRRWKALDSRQIADPAAHRIPQAEVWRRKDPAGLVRRAALRVATNSRRQRGNGDKVTASSA